MLTRSQTPIQGVGRSAWSCEALVDVTAPAAKSTTIDATE